MHFVDPVLLGGSAVGYCGRILDWNGRLFSRGSPYIFDVRVRRFAIARDHPALLRHSARDELMRSITTPFSGPVGGVQALVRAAPTPCPSVVAWVTVSRRPHPHV